MMSVVVEKSFVLEKEPTQETMILKAQIQMGEEFVDMRGVLEQIENFMAYQFKIYDFELQKYQLVSDYFQDQSGRFYVPSRLLQQHIILIKYCLDTTEAGSMRSGITHSDTSSVKKERSKERSIGEVIQIVKQWRELHENQINGRKMNLQEAAAVVGISKKSLDDYYYQLRLGEKYDYDFKSNMEQKVGDLRNYIKQFKGKAKSISSKTEKHPKKLKIIEELYDAPYKKDFEVKGFKTEDDQQEEGDKMSEDGGQNRSMQSIEDQFYNHFQFFKEEPVDPFLNFEMDFKKKGFEDNQMSDGLFF